MSVYRASLLALFVTMSCQHRGATVVPAANAPASPADTSRADGGNVPLSKAPPTKKLIEFGWDAPSAAYVHSHAQVVAQSVFDGLVFHVNLATAASESLAGRAFGSRTFTRGDLEPDMQELTAGKVAKLANSFLSLNLMPGDVDWFDSFAGVSANFELTARAAHDAGLRGILFDIEAYGKSEPFNFPKQRDAAARGFAAYSAQARIRGQELIKAFEKGYKGLTIFLPYGFSLPYQSLKRGWCQALSECPQGLLKPFLEGMLEAATGSTHFIEGDEFAYGLRDPAEFESAARALRTDLPGFSDNTAIYRRRFSVALPIWIDYQAKGERWSETDESGNYYSAAQLEAAVRGALAATDEFVWVYAQKPHFWTKDGAVLGAHPAYGRALGEARGGPSR